MPGKSKLHPSKHYDRRFRRIAGLSWLPWVGAAVPTLPSSRRLLIVGESHYTIESDPLKLPAQLASLVASPDYTREVIHECPVTLKRRNPTLENIQRFLLGTMAEDRPKLWSELSFYNFVQRPMQYAGPEKERPVLADWLAGWTVFQAILQVLKPSHCIFIGVEASNSFDRVMSQSAQAFTPVARLTKVRRTWARTAQVIQHDQKIGLTFMRHAGSHFCYDEWHRVLTSQCDEPLRMLKAGQLQQTQPKSNQRSELKPRSA